MTDRDPNSLRPLDYSPRQAKDEKLVSVWRTFAIVVGCVIGGFFIIALLLLGTCAFLLHK